MGVTPRSVCSLQFAVCSLQFVFGRRQKTAGRQGRFLDAVMRNSMRRVRTFVLGGRGGVPSPNESPQQHVDVPRDELVESKFWIWLFGHESSVIELLPAYIQASTTLSVWLDRDADHSLAC